MKTLTDAVDYINKEYPQHFSFENTFFSSQTFRSGPMPKFLYRGESQLWERTQSTAGRKEIHNDLYFAEINKWITGRHSEIDTILNHYSVYHFLRESLYGISVVEDHFDDPNVDKAIAGLLQHYGFDTSLVDFTSDITVAAFFASFNSPVGSTGRIFVLPTKGAEDYVFDLSLDKASRPRWQKAFALVVPPEYDFKSTNVVSFRDELTVPFRLTELDKEKYDQKGLLSVSEDNIVLELFDWYECHIANNAKVSETVRIYFKNKLDALREHCG